MGWDGSCMQKVRGSKNDWLGPGEQEHNNLVHRDSHTQTEPFLLVWESI